MQKAASTCLAHTDTWKTPHTVSSMCGVSFGDA